MPQIGTEKAVPATFQIPFVDLGGSLDARQLEAILTEISQLASRSDFILGERVSEFEERYARLAGCRYGIGVNSGTDAILLGLRALGIGPGDEVITVANSFVATAAAIALAGARPVLADVAPDYNIDPDKIEPLITERTRAILVVHLTGNPCAMDRIMPLAAKHELFVLEDAAQAIGTTFQGQACGSFGQIGCFSLHPLKNLHVWGDGGMITTSDPELAESLRRHRNHGLKTRDEAAFFSFNSRLDTIQAIVGLHAMTELPVTLTRRKQLAERYDERLGGMEGYVEIPTWDRANASPTHHLYVIQAERRNELKRFLEQHGVETKVHYPIPIHLQAACADLGYPKGSLPVTERLADRILSLPIRENLATGDVDRICDLIRAFYERGEV